MELLLTLLCGVACFGIYKTEPWNSASAAWYTLSALLCAMFFLAGAFGIAFFISRWVGT